MKKNELQTTLEEIKQMMAAQGTVILTFEDATKYLKISKSTLYKLVHFKKLRYSKPNGKRLWFTKADLDNWALQNPSKSNEEIEAEAIKYVNKI